MGTLGVRAKGLRRRRPLLGAGHRDRDRGQTAIEFVGVTPLILLICVAMWQCALIGYTFILAGNAADVGARVGATGGACAAAARKDLPSAWSGTFNCGASGGLYRADVALKVPVLVPGALDWPFTVHGSAASVEEG